MFVINASVIPNETECARLLATDVVATPKIPATSIGQHHEPTKAGMEMHSVKIAAHIPVLSASCPSTGPPEPLDLATGREGMPHTPPSQSSSGARSGASMSLMHMLSLTRASCCEAVFEQAATVNTHAS